MVGCCHGRRGRAPSSKRRARRRRRRRRASPPKLLRGGGGETTCGKAPRPPVRAGGAGQEGPLARGCVPGGSAQVAPATAPSPTRLALSSRSADNSASNHPQPTPFTPASHRGLGAAPDTLLQPLPDCGEQAVTAAGHRSSDERGLSELGGAVGCYPVPPSGHTATPCLPLRWQPRQKRRQALSPTKHLITSHHPGRAGRRGVVTGMGGGVVANPTA